MDAIEKKSSVDVNNEPKQLLPIQFAYNMHMVVNDVLHIVWPRDCAFEDLSITGTKTIIDKMSSRSPSERTKS